MEESYLDFFNRNRDKYLHTDKNSHHNYITEYYDGLFSPLRNISLNILEIGNYRGDFLRLCRDYLTNNCTIVGIDLYLHKECQFLTGITFYNADAYIQDTLDMFPDEYFDICIDDGSHKPEDQRYFIEKWLNKVKLGGKLIIEDLPSKEFSEELLKSLISKEYTQHKIIDLMKSGEYTDHNIIIEIIK
jgi:hypothetical protein